MTADIGQSRHCRDAVSRFDIKDAGPMTMDAKHPSSHRTQKRLSTAVRLRTYPMISGISAIAASIFFLFKIRQLLNRFPSLWDSSGVVDGYAPWITYWKCSVLVGIFGILGSRCCA